MGGGRPLPLPGDGVMGARLASGPMGVSTPINANGKRGWLKAADSGRSSAYRRGSSTPIPHPKADALGGGSAGHGVGFGVILELVAEVRVIILDLGVGILGRGLGVVAT